MSAWSRILVPLDGSDRSERALALAALVARSMQGELLLVRAADAHSFPGSDPSESQLSAVTICESYLDGLVSAPMSAGLVVLTAVPYGSPAESIVLEERLRAADAIVMATHGRGGVALRVLGSVAAEVLRTARSPLVLIPDTAVVPTGPNAIGTVLVPLDGSAAAEEVLPSVIQFAQAVGAELLLLKVVEQTQEFEAAEAYLRTLIQGTNDSTTVSMQLLTSIGEPAPTILGVARERKIDLISMASHGRTGLRRLLMGSVTESVIQHAPVPVLVLRSSQSDD